MKVAAEMQALLDEVVEIVQRHDVPDAVVREFLRLADERYPRPPRVWYDPWRRR